MALYLGIDIGTSASKGVMIDATSFAKPLVDMRRTTRVTDGTSMMRRQFGGAIFAACRASWWRDRGLTRHRSDAWAFPHWAATAYRSIPSATRWRPRFCMESMHVRSRRLTSFFPNMGQIAHASFSGTIPVRQILLPRSCGLRRICPRCTNVPRSS